MADNGTLGRLHTMMCPKPPPEAPKYKHEMRAIDPEAEKRAAAARSNLGIALLGPVFGAPAVYARAAGAPTEIVDQFSEMGLNLASAVSLKGAGGGGRILEPVAVRPVATSKPVAGGRNGTVVAKKTYDAKDFVSEHAYKRHGYDPNKTSKPNHTRYADDVDPKRIADEMMKNPDKLEELYDKNGNHYATKYSKDMGYPISQPR